MPPEEPAGQNPPDGAIINYYLKSAASGPVTLEILDADGHLVRPLLEHRSGAADPGSGRPRRCRSTGTAPPQTLSTRPGCTASSGTCTISRSPGGGGGRGGVPTRLPIPAIPYNIAGAATTPWAAPGTYTVKLTVDGKSYTQPLA